LLVLGAIGMVVGKSYFARRVPPLEMKERIPPTDPKVKATD
jgi:hypothetical protein